MGMWIFLTIFALFSLVWVLLINYKEHISQAKLRENAGDKK